MIRVLQVIGTLGLGGAESRVMDIYRHTDREKIQFDFLTTEGSPDHYEAEVESLGGRVYHLPAFRVVNYLEYKRACDRFFEEHVHNGVSEYAAVHGHMTSTASIYLKSAARHGVPLRIGHARSAGVDPGLKGIATRFLRRNLYKYCDVMLACSDMAGDSVFGAGRDHKFIPNAIDTKEFSFDNDIRGEVRGKYGIGDEFLIGHVGSFRYAKNHEFLVEVFKLILTKRPECRLFLAGDGVLKESIEKLAADMGIRDKVMFAGNVSPVAPLYNAFDLLIFPSHYEGMPGTIVEAQASGLMSIMSDRITSQVIYTDRVKVMSLDSPANVWADEACRLADEICGQIKRGAYDNYRRDVRATGKDPDISRTMFDVNSQVDFYEKLYGANR